MGKDKKLGLVLEGGGARGAYQIGAVKALYENGISFSAVVGTSIGAINGAFLAQNDFPSIYDMWTNLSFKDLFDIDETKLNRVLKGKLEFDDIKYFSKLLNEYIKIGGIDTIKIKEIVTNKINEEKIRNSNIDFGLVTMCVSDMSPQELFISDIPNGKLTDYIMATSNLPVFKRAIVDNKKYLDGGVWDNCPVSMLESKNFSDAIVIRAYKRNRIRGYNGIIKRNNITMHMIEPVDSLGSILNFDTDNLNRLVTLGYFDGLRFIHDFDGKRYYIVKTRPKEITNMLNNIDFSEIVKICNMLKIKLNEGDEIKEKLKNKVIPSLLSRAKIKKSISLKESILLILEYVADIENIDKFRVYNFDEFVNIIQSKISSNNSNIVDKNNVPIYEFVKALYC